MSTYAHKRRERHSSVATNGFAHKESNGYQSLRPVNQRPAAITQRALAESLNQSDKVQSQLQLQQMLNESPRVVAQRKLAEVLSGRKGALQSQQAMQRQEATEDEEMIQRQVSLEDEEPLQGKFVVTQREKLPEEEEPIQSKAEAVQRQESLEEEEPLQGRFKSLQRQSVDEDEKPLQGKSMAIQRAEGLEEEEPLQAKTQVVQKKENRTGLPDELKAGVENLSGLSMDDVQVHYNSSAPATVQALAYTQGTEIHVGPGQEQHLAHEAWHVAQQKQGRVKPTMQARGVAINDDTGLEREADVMGGKAAQNPAQRMESASPVGLTSTVFQRYTEPPSKIVVDVDTVSGKILKVENGEGANIEFVFADTHKGNVPEGSVVFLNATTTVSVRFATDTTDISNLGGMRKIAPKNVETREVEGVKEKEEKTPIKEVEEETVETFDLNLKVGEGESIISEKFTGFEKGQTGDQGLIHFEKHGDEFDAETKGDYIRMAKLFGEAGDEESLEAIIGNTIIKVDPPGLEVRRVFIANAKKIRTFYVWDPDFSSDPFAYAVYYTITHNMGIPLADVNPQIMEQFKVNGINLFAMEVEVVTKLLGEGLSKQSVADQTLAPMKLINRILSQNWRVEMRRAFLRSESTTSDLDPELAARALKNLGL